MGLAKDSDNLKKYVCAGPERGGVCCGPVEFFMTDYEMECNGNATSFPPDPERNCCGVDGSVENKIFGGKDAEIDEYPWMAVIEYVKNNDRLLLCGGSLISNRYVLTAAHCVKGPIQFIGTPKFVRLGEYNVAHRGPDCVGEDVGEDDCTDGAFIAPINKTVAHPQFRPYHTNRRYDIALIRLEIIVPYTAFIRPICLPRMDYTISPPEELLLTVAGWGTYKQNLTANIYYTSDIKQYVQLPYVDKQKCQELIRKVQQKSNFMLYEGQICAGGVLGKDSCNADSGGPLMYEENRVFEVIGIVSFGSELCGQEEVPGVYTHVYDFIPWIKKTIKQ